MGYELELLLDAKALLGEGPCWDAENQRLIWVDIEGHTVHLYNPESGEDEVFDVGERVGAAVLREGGGLVLALTRGFYSLDLKTGEVAPLASPDGQPQNTRFNDGKCDAEGRFWAGTMGLTDEPSRGSFYCLDTDLQCRTAIQGVTCSNGIAWSPDYTTMYYNDTPTGQVMAYDFDARTGTIANPRVAVRIPEGQGGPDGMTSDKEGNLWVAQWGGYQVARYNPKTGECIDVIKTPAAHTTSVCFGGKDMTELFITTARVGISEEQLASTQALAGGLFRVKTGVVGMPTHAFRG